MSAMLEKQRITDATVCLLRKIIIQKHHSGMQKRILCELTCDEYDSTYVTLDHKTSLKSLEYICSNSQKYMLWVKIIDFSFMPKIIRILNKDHVS